MRQHENGVGPATINSAVSALRFLFLVTLQRRDLSRALVITRYQRKLPDVLSVDEAARLLEAAPGIKYSQMPAKDEDKQSEPKANSEPSEEIKRHAP